MTFLVEKPYRRQTIQFSRENINLRFSISWGHETLGLFLFLEKRKV